MMLLQVLYKSMKGVGTNDAALIRVIVTRAEMDMEYIKTEFLNTYGKTLERMISSDISGDYKAFLLTLVSGQPKWDLSFICYKLQPYLFSVILYYYDHLCGQLEVQYELSDWWCCILALS